MKISVVVPTLIENDKQLSLTLRCLELARRLTKLPFELVIVETETEYLEDYADIYIHEEKRTTATKSINRGFSVCSGDYVVLLTNDVLVSDLWLEKLLECFKGKSDCGIATLGTTQLKHSKHDEIKEGIWFSLAMFKKQDEYFDERFVNSWDDTDFIMRQYIQGKKMYRNYGCIVEHDPGQTQYDKKDHMINYRKNMNLFKEKYKEYKDTDMYKLLIEGWVI